MTWVTPSDAAADGVTLVTGHQPVMGTHLDLQITASTPALAEAADAAAVAEALRLEACFTVFDPASELCRWRSGELAVPGPELAALLVLAGDWQDWSGGAFNPLAGVLTERWLLAAVQGVEPPVDELADLSASIRAPRWTVTDGRVDRIGDCSPTDLNALAKGHVVESVAAHLMVGQEVTRLVVNAGGDLVHRGEGVLRVAVEDPFRAYDNAPPLTRIEVRNAAVATSGRSRRWFEIGGTRRSRVLDPRSGRPVEHTASATVVAPDAATADALATVTSVLTPPESMALLAELRAEGLEVAALIVDADGVGHPSAGWDALAI